MAKGAKPNDIFDVDRIRQIIELMEDHDLHEVDLQQGEEKIRLARGGVAPMQPMMAAAPAAMPAAATPGSGAGGNNSGGDSSEAGTVTINAPMVGTFYTKPNPDADSFIKVGDRIGPDTVVCIVEAMKVFNEIPAEISGEVVDILLTDGTAVDFNKPMIRVRTS